VLVVHDPISDKILEISVSSEKAGLPPSMGSTWGSDVAVLRCDEAIRVGGSAPLLGDLDLQLGVENKD
jgi:hypothetical protein